MKRVFVFVFVLINLGVFAQDNEFADNRSASTIRSSYAAFSDTMPKLFSNTDLPGVSFIVSSNVKENLLHINTNYSGEYKVRFVDYYSHTRIVFKNNHDNIALDLDAFEKSIFFMYITDNENRTLTSQVINLKRRHL